jgi:hypothetical protein
MMPQPHLTFACELESGLLAALLERPELIPSLQQLGATVSLGLLDLSADRAAAVRRLNAAGVPLVAWLLLPKEQGYWFNADNATAAVARWDDFLAWTAAEGLRWDGVGLDIEPHIADVEAVMQRRWGDLAPVLARRAFDAERLRAARLAYGALVTRIQGEGYPVQSYQVPFIADERLAGSALLQRIAGLVDVPADCEIFMLYSSFMGKLGPGFLWSYGPEACGIGIGSTGGGVDVAAGFKSLSWDRLARDLRLACRLTNEIFIFSLEGCVREGYLEPLVGFDWDAPVPIPAAETRRVNAIRAGLQGALWAGSHPWAVVMALGAVGLALRGARRRR